MRHGNAIIERDDGAIQYEGRFWRTAVDEIIDKEREALGGFTGLGSFERDYIVARRGPESARKLLERARQFPDLVAVNAPFSGPTGTPGGPPSSYSPVATTNAETGLWTPAQAAFWSPVPALDMQAGKSYEIKGGGIISTSSAAPTALWTPRCGVNATLANDPTMGASSAATVTASLASAPLFFDFVMFIRSLGLAASGASGTCNGGVWYGGITTTMGLCQPIGGTVFTTVDNTAAVALLLTLTWGTSAATNTCTCQWNTPVRSHS